MPKKHPPQHEPYRRVNEKFMKRTPTIFSVPEDEVEEVAQQEEKKVVTAVKAEAKKPTKKTSTKTSDNVLKLPVAKKELKEAKQPKEIEEKENKPTEPSEGRAVKTEKVKTAPVVAAVSSEKTIIRYPTTSDEKQELQNLAMRFSAKAHTKVELAKLLRACGQVLLSCEKQLMDAVDSHGLPKRPRNDDPASINDFDHHITKIVTDAIRKSPSVKL